jgi:hypothetical protein
MHLPVLRAWKPVVTRSYGRDSLLLAVNPVLAGIAAALGLRVGLKSAAQVEADMERDAKAMRKRGYAVDRAEEFHAPVAALPTASATWYRVTYRRIDPPPKGS